MNELLTDIASLVFRSTLFLSLGACIATMGLMLTATRSHKTMAIVWSMVLLAGLLLAPARLEIPWYAADSGAMPDNSAAAETAHLATASESARLPAASSGPTNDRQRSGKESETAVAEPMAAMSMQAAARTTLGFGGAFLWQTLPTLWILGLAIIGTIAMASYTGLLWSLRETWLPQRCWQTEYDEAAESLGVDMPPRMLVHPRLGPLVCLTPRGHCLVIPSDQWSSLSQSQREVILKHELAHFIRRDVWRTVPARIIVLLHWFNPLAWLAARRVEESAEWAADEIAIGDDPGRTGDLASALLQLSQHTHCSRLLAPAARGRSNFGTRVAGKVSRSLSKRLKRLIHQTEIKGDEPMLRPVGLIMVMAMVLVAGAVQIRLVAQDTAAAESGAVEGQPADGQPPESGAQAITSKTAIQFASRLVGDDELTRRLRASLQSDPGALVLRDRAGYYEAMALQDARAEAIPRFFDELFQSTDSGLNLRAGNDRFRDAFLSSSRKLDHQIAEIKSVLQEKAERLEVESDLDKLFHRFLTDDAAPVILFAKQLRPRMMPGSELMERLFEQQLAKRRDGLYAVRPDARPGIEERFKIYDERMRLLERIQQDLAEFGGLITPVDDFHIRFKAVLKNPVVATQLSLPIFEGERLNRRLYENIVNQFEGAVREGPEGLVIQDPAMEHLERVLPNLERVAKTAESLRDPLAKFATKISQEDDFHKKYKKMLATDLVLVRTAVAVQYADVDVRTAIDTYFTSFLSEQDNGKLKVSTANVSEEQIIGLVSSIFREARVARRKGRDVADLVARITDPELREAMASPGGKMAIGDELIKRHRRNVTDGLAQWVSEHFEETEDGYAIREERRTGIEEFVRHIDEVTKELDNADF